MWIIKDNIILPKEETFQKLNKVILNVNLIMSCPALVPWVQMRHANKQNIFKWAIERILECLTKGIKRPMDCMGARRMKIWLWFTNGTVHREFLQITLGFIKDMFGNEHKVKVSFTNSVWSAFCSPNNFSMGPFLSHIMAVGLGASYPSFWLS